jgi:hypothetical protein
MTDYYAHTYSQRDVDLIRGDLMARITELTTERDARDKQVRELVEAAKAVIATITTQTPDPHSDVVVDYGKLLRLEDALAAHLKEQDDE